MATQHCTTSEAIFMMLHGCYIEIHGHPAFKRNLHFVIQESIDGRRRDIVGQIFPSQFKEMLDVGLLSLFEEEEKYGFTYKRYKLHLFTITKNKERKKK